ncbi:alpha-glucoside-specific PTS transporter subunit IIBC [Caldibacillus debilis]|uniref:alpha-glucoside-specific PTS transporter subunit IIBC n=1 Tax=Caldibacillus debilis TaxID=301148 RepID=UPI0023F3EF1B|nr:alpha-glucoside-specific PTS transporter subunit IIBC [Caldibacillus debilis]
MRSSIMQKLQRFGAAMFTPVLFFSFSGIVIAISIMLTNPSIMGNIADEGTFWYKFWMTIQNGAWTIFNQMELIFVTAIPIGLAKKAPARAGLEALLIYLTFNYFVNSMLTFWGSVFGVDFSADISHGASGTGLKMIAGIKTLDTNVIGAIFIAAISVWIHNRYFDKKLPDWLGVFQGSALVAIIGFVIMLPVALLTCVVWPVVQDGISALQGVMATSGVVGIWIYNFLNRILIPTGLHHFIYFPFLYGPAVVDGGIVKYWLEHLPEFARSTESLKELFPEGAFALFGSEKVFAPIGIAAAFYMTANPKKKKQVLTILIPAVLTAVLTGITEPFEFTFLFVAPILFVIYALISATMDTLMFVFGVSGDFDTGLIDWITKNWLPLHENHWQTYLVQILIGLIFVVIYFVVFRFLILRYDYATPGREPEDVETKLYRKADYKKKQESEAAGEKEKDQSFAEKAAMYLEALGGRDNIKEVTNCATRLRVTVADEKLVAPDNEFKKAGAHGVVRNGKSIQVIVGLSVPQVREELERLMNYEIK